MRGLADDEDGSVIKSGGATAPPIIPWQPRTGRCSVAGPSQVEIELTDLTFHRGEMAFKGHHRAVQRPATALLRRNPLTHVKGAPRGLSAPLEFDRAEGEITEADDAGAKHQQPKQTIFKHAGGAPGRGRWRTHYYRRQELILSAAHSAKPGL